MKHDDDALPGADLDALLMSQYAPAVALAGKPAEVRRMAEVSIARAHVHSHYSECVTAALASWALALLGDHEAAAPIALRALELANADNFPTWTSRQLVVVGLSAMAAGSIDEGFEQFRTGMDGRRQEGQLCDHSAMLCLAAEALMNAGRDGAEDLLSEAAEFCETTGELYAESEIYRLRAKLLTDDGSPAAEREMLLRRALDLAQLRGIHWHAMLAASDLASILLDAGRGAEAKALLEPALRTVTGGSQLPAIVGAEKLLARCDGS
jgi:tetratricopeptide (TPR) repeat protein